VLYPASSTDAPGQAAKQYELEDSVNKKAQKKLVKSRNKMERQAFIKSALHTDGYISTASICKKFNVSDQTARTDLAELEKQGICKKGHGGAVPFDKTAKEWPEEIVTSIQNGLIDKRNALFGKTTTVFLPGDPLLVSLARNLGQLFEKDTIIFTDSIDLAKRNAGQDGHETILLPGKVNRKTGRTHGRELEKFLKTSNTIISTAIFRINHIDVEQKNVGFPNRLDGIIAEEIFFNNRAEEVILISTADVLKEKKPFHSLKLAKQKIRYFIRAAYKDAKKLSDVTQIAQEHISIEIDRRNHKIIHL